MMPARVLHGTICSHSGASARNNLLKPLEPLKAILYPRGSSSSGRFSGDAMRPPHAAIFPAPLELRQAQVR